MNHADSAKRKAKMVEKWRELQNNQAVAEEFGVTREYVRQVMKSRGLISPGRSYRLKRENPAIVMRRENRKTLILAAHKSGARTIEEFADITSISKKNMSDFLRRHLPDLEVADMRCIGGVRKKATGISNTI